MAAATAAASKIPANLLTVYEDLKKQYLADAPQMEYKPQSASALRSQLAAALKPAYDAAVRQRQQQTAQGRASIDADAAARGMGSSTWVTDRKGRLGTSEASDLTSLRGSYSAALASQLMSKLGEQENKRLSIEQYNKGQQANAHQNAWNTAMAKYAEWDPAAQTGGGGGWGGPATDPDMAAYLKELEAAQKKTEAEKKTQQLWSSAAAAAAKAAAAKTAAAAKAASQPYVYTSAPSVSAPAKSPTKPRGKR